MLSSAQQAFRNFIVWSEVALSKGRNITVAMSPVYRPLRALRICGLRVISRSHLEQ